ncbi:MAG: thioredoxin family protein [gamma proteobacterium symbiont of Bathyaustriella thionipta]|nr:thioredoxin family protein [gamma proteobacterium symbiont of Bathyaustriella thionipta]MCU7949966.1 thioredoxin family protein [gamma proteobacterium symbiont of Bathyaustriella thionipta]MCU7953621.1 thioredoxin family protein [gamma proteobacterium symbiont of Bathyaustriella thionipta]MCU7956530.1 thioredoxin family protein [gamma proteobacterium symbiont of Bathyaustriella thionipta]MCU7968793.1 thioredoxin family protein [gamma proteobacterium symbiont of Bathyaustriella thionipta]
MQKIHFITLIFIIIFFSICSNYILAGHQSHSQRPKLKQITDIRETAELAKASKLPILMMFGTDECPYCELLKEDFLIPMIISGDYTDKIIFREVHVAWQADMTDFSGKKSPSMNLVSDIKSGCSPPWFLLMATVRFW